MKFIVDTQLPPKLSTFLNGIGHNSWHTTDYPNGHLLKDKEIRQIAIDEDRIIISKDNDFFDHFLLKGSPPKVLLVALGNISNNDLIQLFETHISTIENGFNNQSSLVNLDKNNLSYF